MKRTFLVVSLLLLLVMIGCKEKPTKVVRFPGPSPAIFFTVETWQGKGTLATDFTRVFAHLENNGSEDRIVVLDGAYLEISNIHWSGEHDVTIYVAQGRSNTFRNNVVLNAGGESLEINSHIAELGPK